MGDFSRLLAWMAGVLVLTAAAGCEQHVTAVSGTEQPFSIYGVISPQLDSQWVRVYAIEGRLDPIRPEPLDARFVSTDLETGVESVWRDSLIREADGAYAHVFWAPFRAEYGHAYRFEVARSDGAVTRAETVVPPRTEVVLGEPAAGAGLVVLPVSIRGAAPRLLRIEVGYSVDFRLTGPGVEPDRHIVVPYDGAQRQAADGWTIPIDLAADFETVRSTLARQAKQPLDRAYGILLLGVTLRLIVASDDWDPPGGVFDPDVLVQPATMSNVVNGFGFVGAGYRLQHRWNPPPDVVEAAGFRRPAP